MAPIGKGEVVSGKGCEGVLHSATTVDEVFQLLKKPNLDEIILLTDSASATAVVPLLAKVKGVVCRSGGATSHLATVSREFGLACVMGAELQEDDLEGAHVVVHEDGQIVRA